ncbi:MAG: hypothetical protein ACLSXK_04755 [Lactococcus petauri]
MKKVKLLERENDLFGRLIDVHSFEEETRKEFPYYQNGKKYAVCPTCGSSVQLIGGENNREHSRVSNSLYAAHTKSSINGFAFDATKKNNCPNYTGNENNWQGIYESNRALPINQEVEHYILNNEIEIAEELSQITGIKFEKFNHKEKIKEANSLFDRLFDSFRRNGGLMMRPENFVPEFIPRLLIQKAAPIPFWGYVIWEKSIRERIKKHKQLSKFLSDKQFCPNINVSLVGTLDDDENPKWLLLKLVWNKVVDGDELSKCEYTIRKIPANI